MSSYSDALAGKDVAVDFASIEKAFAELWREQSDSHDAVTRAAIWTVIAHTDNEDDRRRADEVISAASAKIPQRSILIRANPSEPSGMTATISTNSHEVGGGKQMYSEEISLLAGGDRVHHVPPLVEALLLPNVPVAAWWLGDLPTDERYFRALLDPVDRVIVDSSEFGLTEHFVMLSRITELTCSTAADLNWSRLDEWRRATATIFDAAITRPWLRRIERVEVACASPDGKFANVTSSLLYLAWLFRAGGYEVMPDGTVHGPGGEVDWRIEQRRVGATGRRRMKSIDIKFDDGSRALVQRDIAEGAVQAYFEGGASVTRVSETSLAQLLLRQLSRPDDTVLPKVIPGAVALAGKIRG